MTPPSLLPCPEFEKWFFETEIRSLTLKEVLEKAFIEGMNTRTPIPDTVVMKRGDVERVRDTLLRTIAPLMAVGSVMVEGKPSEIDEALAILTAAIEQKGETL